MLNFKPFQQLSPMQWCWLWSAYWRLWPTLVRIKLKQGDWLRRKISVLDSGAAVVNSDALQADDDALLLHEAVRLAARLHFLPADCLPKSIVLADMLRQNAYNASVVIGVNRKSDRFASHAWVEIDGVMLGEPESVATDFTVIKS